MPNPNYKLLINEPPFGHIQTHQVLLWLGVQGYPEARAVHAHLKEHAPCVLLDGISRAKSQDLSDMIESCGGDCEILETDTAAPVMLWPPVEREYERRGGRFLRPSFVTMKGGWKRKPQ